MKQIPFFLCLFFIIAVLLRFAFLNNTLFFGPEQGRDFLVIKDIVLNHKLTLIGSKTDIPGIFHGPIFYYLSTIPFLLAHGDPLSVSLFFIFINSTTVFFLYLLGKKIRSARVGLIAALLFTFSFNAIVYARWLSNPPLSIPFVAMAMYFFVAFLKGSKKSLIGYAICLGLLNQSEFLNLLFFSTFTIFVVIIFFDHFKKASLLFLIGNFLIASLLSVGTFVLFDIRHQFLITSNILYLLVGQTGFHTSFVSVVQKSISTYLNTFTLTILPFESIPSFLILLAGTVIAFSRSKKDKAYRVLLLWLFIPVVLLICVRHDVLDQFFVSCIPVFLLFAALVIDSIWEKSTAGGILTTGAFIIIGLVTWIQNIPTNNHIFFQLTQPDLRYSDELQTIDRIYQEADSKPFAIQAYTIPYWSQQSWQYLFWSYGERKYGNALIEQKDAKTLFVIIQADPGNFVYQHDWLNNTVTRWGKTKKEFRYGILTTRELQLE